MAKLNLTHNATVNLTYSEKRMVLRQANAKQLTVSALIREILKAALEPDGTERPK